MAQTQEITLLEALYDTYRDLMYYTANIILHDPALAEEAVLQAFTRLKGLLPQLCPLDSLKTKNLVVIVVRTIAIAMYHTQTKSSALSFDEVVDWRPDDASGSGDADYQELVRTLRMMPEGYRNILLLRYDNGLEAAQVAQLLGVSLQVVKTRLQRARERLANLLNNM